MTSLNLQGNLVPNDVTLLIPIYLEESVVPRLDIRIVTYFDLLPFFRMLPCISGLLTREDESLLKHHLTLYIYNQRTIFDTMPEFQREVLSINFSLLRHEHINYDGWSHLLFSIYKSTLRRSWGWYSYVYL